MAALQLVDVEPGDDRLGQVWAVMSWLREQLDEATLRARCAAGYADGRCVAAAGWRITTTFAHGRFLFVDDLVVESDAPSQGYR